MLLFPRSSIQFSILKLVSPVDRSRWINWRIMLEGRQVQEKLHCFTTHNLTVSTNSGVGHRPTTCISVLLRDEWRLATCYTRKELEWITRSLLFYINLFWWFLFDLSVIKPIEWFSDRLSITCGLYSCFN